MRRSSLHIYIVWCVALLSLAALAYAYKPPGSILREPFQGRREFHFGNGGHYGDNILNLKFLYNNAELLKANDIFIHYHYPAGNIGKVEELQRYVDGGCVELDASAAPPDAVVFWMKDPIDGLTVWDNFSAYYSLLYRNILQTLSLEDKGVDTSLFQKEEYLLDIYEGLDETYKNVDILILNAEPKSGQFAYNKAQMDALIREISQRFRVVTTTPVDPSIPCTMDGGLSLQDIGAVSTHAKYIFGVNSGPLIPCFNAAAQAHVKKWIILDNNPSKFDGVSYIVLQSLPDAQTLFSQFTIE